MEKLSTYLIQEGFESENLDHLVENIAKMVNQKGLTKQVEFLLDNGLTEQDIITCLGAEVDEITGIAQY
jgi:hypothetical protein